MRKAGLGQGKQWPRYSFSTDLRSRRGELRAGQPPDWGSEDLSFAISPRIQYCFWFSILSGNGGKQFQKLLLGLPYYSSCYPTGKGTLEILSTKAYVASHYTFGD